MAATRKPRNPAPLPAALVDAQLHDAHVPAGQQAADDAARAAHNDNGLPPVDPTWAAQQAAAVDPAALSTDPTPAPPATVDTDPLAALVGLMGQRAASPTPTHPTTTAPPAYTRAGGQSSRGGLTPQALRVLAVLVANDDAGGAPLSRKQLHTRTGQAKGWSALLGAHGRPDGGSKGLVDAGYVQLHTTGGQYTYSATPKGRAALVSAQGYHATVG